MSKHFLTDDKQGSYCEATGEFDVYMSGEFAPDSAPQPDDFCLGCREANPEWTHIEDDEFHKMEL